MNTSKSNNEDLKDYAVDVATLKDIHQRIVSKRAEIETLVAEEQNFGSLASIDEEAKQKLRSIVDKLLAERQTEEAKDGTAATGSVAFNKLADELMRLEQKIFDAENEQVHEATQHPFDHPLR